MSSNFMLKLENLYDEEKKRTIKPSSTLARVNLQNIQKILDKFKYIPRRKNFSVEFSEDANVYSCDPLLPDMWLRTRSPFDKNQVFFIHRQGWSSDPRKIKRFNFLEQEPNYFPSFPLNISRTPELSSHHNMIKKIEIVSTDKLFSQHFDHLTSSKSDQEQIEKKERKENQLPLMCKDNILDKNWIISSILMDKVFNYGPVTSFKLFLFLREMYTKMSTEEKEKKRFLIVDTVCDIHYQPETVYDLLKEEYDKRTVLKEKFQPLEPQRSRPSKFDFTWKRKTDTVDKNNYTSTKSEETCADSNLSSRTPRRKRKDKLPKKTKTFGIRAK